MKPISLTMQAFGSYGKKISIDFTVINQNLFLVTGDTGAGKTTIFDAIVFALYGETGSSVNKKEGSVLKSQYVGIDVTPFVEYTFIILGQTYTVKRIPRHMRALKRASSKGNTETEEQGSVELLMPDGLIYPPKEADAKIKDIVGLTKEQFMQVAMIAQGEFMELLHTKSDDRKIIFRKLFNTGIYNNIVNELADRKREYDKETEILNEKCRAYINRVRLPGQYAREENFMQYHNQIKKGSLANLSDYVAELDILCGEITADENKLKNEYNEARTRRDKSMAHVAEAGQLIKFYEQLDDAEKQLEECCLKEPEILKTAELMKKVNAAYSIYNTYRRMEDAERLVGKSESELQKIIAVLPETERKLEDAKRSFEIIRQRYDSESEELHKIQERINRELEVHKRKKEAEDRCGELEEKRGQIEREIENKNKKLTKALKAEAEYKTQLKNNEGSELKFERWETCYKEFKDILSELDSIKDDAYKAAKIKEQHNKALKDYEDAKKIYSYEKERYDGDYQAFLDDQAGILARGLVPDKPCPVCGSVLHPNPCQSIDGTEVKDRAELRKMEERVEQQRKEREDCSHNARDLKVKYEFAVSGICEGYVKLADKIKGLIVRGIEYSLFNAHEIRTAEFDRQIISETVTSLKTAGETTDKLNLDFERELKVIEELHNILDEAGEEVRRSREKYHFAKTQLEETEKARIDTSEMIKALEDNLTEVKLEVQTERAALERMQTEIYYASAGEAKAAGIKSQERFDAVKNQYGQAEKMMLSLSEKYSETNSLIKKLEDDIPLQRSEFAERSGEYKAALCGAGMSDSEWRELVGSYDMGKLEIWQKDINSFNEKRAAADKQYHVAKKAIEGRCRPDIRSLELERDAADEAADIIANKYDDIKNLYRVNREVHDGMKKLLDERIEVVRTGSRIERLYKVLSGNMSGARMDLETYVQRHYLEQILYAANIRFREMSSGQYEFRMYDINKAREGKNRGLDLMVYSAVTGKEREIRTLSGGESFMAALSLALGMADRIQSGSASISLDMMFIDEGFGMLDEYSRTQAVKVLKEMSGGSKIVGIISHVSELKHEIDNRLIVTKDDAGSSARWTIM